MYSEINVTSCLKRVINYGNNITAASRQVTAPGARIGQLPSRKSRYFQIHLMHSMQAFDTLSLLLWTVDIAYMHCMLIETCL